MKLLFIVYRLKGSSAGWKVFDLGTTLTQLKKRSPEKWLPSLAGPPGQGTAQAHLRQKEYLRFMGQRRRFGISNGWACPGYLLTPGGRGALLLIPINSFTPLGVQCPSGGLCSQAASAGSRWSATKKVKGANGTECHSADL